MGINRSNQMQTYPKRLHRSGFTLVELMIVIGVILLLMTVTIAAFANFVLTSKEQATAATINKINKIIQQRKDAFDRLNLKDSAKRLHALNSSIGLRTAEVIVRKQRFAFAFPQRYEERSLFNGIDYSTYFSGLPVRPNYESAALLYLAITQGETFGAPQVDDDNFAASEIASIPITIGSNTVDLKYFIDAWGQPLRFYRWPTGLIRPTVGGPIDRSYSALLAPALPPVNALNPSSDPLANDPDDPTQFFLAFYSNLSASDRNAFATNFRLSFTPSTYHTPLIVSAGPDRSLGLYEPNDATAMNGLAVPISTSPPTSTSPVQDNITNLNQRNRGN